MPDTQLYSQNYPGIFLAQTAWIVQNQKKRNIKYVFHLGDITNNNVVGEWENAQMALTLMDGKVPYAFCPGNHDYGPGGSASSRQSHLNDYLPAENYLAWPTFGGCMEPGKMDNTYHLFSAGGHDWIALALEWAPRDSTIAWAETIMKKHPNRLGIMFTHAYLNNNNLRYDHTDEINPQRYNPHLYSTPGAKNDGRQLWEKLIKKHNFVFVFNGHVLGDGTGYLASTNDAGHTVHQILANYQIRELGGEGYLRLLEFLPDGKTLLVKTYSPIFDKYLLVPDQQFTIKIDLNRYD
ncbi:MAG: metallophosphatase [Planctomycetes bacterium]|nr:metallophosphatase [Planctomycetota bacterium]